MKPDDMLLDSFRNRDFTMREMYEADESGRNAISDLMAQRLGLSKQGAPLDQLLRHARASEKRKQDDEFQMHESTSTNVQTPSTFGDLIHPLTVESFFSQQYRNRRPMLFRGSASRFSSLLEWEDFNRLIRSRNLKPPQFRLVADGKPIAGEILMRGQYGLGSRRYAAADRRIDERKLLSFLRNGATLIVNSIGSIHSPINSFMAGLERTLATNATANMYASWRETKGFVTHWDAHDVFVIQIQGQKLWSILGEGRRAPLPMDVESNLAPPSDPMWQDIVKAGDVLFIPRGWFHHAQIPSENDGQGSIHITLRIQNFTGHDVMTWWASKLTSKHAWFRMNVPMCADATTSQAYFQQFRQFLTDSVNETNFEDFMNDMRSQWRGEAEAHLHEWIDPWQDANWDDYEISLRGSPNAVIVDDEEQSFLLVADGFSYRFDQQCEPVFKRLINAKSTVRELKTTCLPGLSTQFINEFLKYLLTKDILNASVPIARAN